MAQPSAPTSLGRRGLFFLNLFLFFPDVQLRSRSGEDSVGKSNMRTIGFPSPVRTDASGQQTAKTADGRRQQAAPRQPDKSAKRRLAIRKKGQSITQQIESATMMSASKRAVRP
ncbi:hypothetical protein IWX91DRAFT_52802 [Phyllosticta citricarpa]